MALDFPTSPANGATYSGYTYDATKGVWVINSSTITNMTVSDTAPSNPLSGDSWFDSTTGYVFVYYTDADSSQWVQTTGAYIDTALTNRVTTVEARTTAVENVNTTQNSRLTSLEGYAQQSPNYIINGGFDIWQRGTSATITAGGYVAADRWTFTSAGTGISCVQSRETIVPNQSVSYSARYQQSGNATSVTEYRARTWLELGHMRPLVGNTVTLSFWYRSSITGTHSARTGIVNATGSGLDSTVNFTVSSANTWQYVTTTHSSFLNVTGYSVGDTSAGAFVDIGYGAGTTSVPNGSNFYIAAVQLEAGSTATPFRRNSSSLQAELAACQRYYITGTMGGTYYIGTSNGTGVGYHTHSFVPMRVAPTATVLTFTNSDNSSNLGISVLGNGRVNGNFRNSNTSFPYYNFTATFKLEAEL